MKETERFVGYQPSQVARFNVGATAVAEYWFREVFPPEGSRHAPIVRAS